MNKKFVQSKRNPHFCRLTHKLAGNMKRVIRIVLVAALAVPAVLSAQQDPYYTHFTFNKVLLNPAYAGASGSFCLNAISHQQWRGLEDQTSAMKTQSGLPVSDNFTKNIAPKTSGFAFYAPINIGKGSGEEKEITNYGGVYFGFVNDVVAYEKNTYMRGGIAGAYPLGSGSIRLGVDFVSLTKELDGDKMRAHDVNDPRIPTGKTGSTHMTLGAGIYYQNPDMNHFYIGLSSSHIKPREFTYGTGSQLVQIQTARHFYLMSGLKLENFLGNPALTLDPALLVKTVNEVGIVKPQLDLQGMVTWNNLYAGGLNLRTYGVGMDALSLMIGYYPPIKGNSNDPNANQTLRVGYSYDITLQSLRRSSSGTHELQVNYCFRIKLPEKIYVPYRHPRYMQRQPDIE